MGEVEGRQGERGRLVYSGYTVIAAIGGRWYLRGRLEPDSGGADWCK